MEGQGQGEEGILHGRYSVEGWETSIVGAGPRGEGVFHGGCRAGRSEDPPWRGLGWEEKGISMEGTGQKDREPSWEGLGRGSHAVGRAGGKGTPVRGGRQGAEWKQ